MVLKYGYYSVKQLSVWVRDFDFPVTGVLSLKQLQELKIKLLVEQERSKEDKDAGIDVEIFVPDLRAFECWFTEVNIRERIHEAVTEIISKSQNVQLGLDLDASPQRRRPLQTEHPSASTVPIHTSGIQLCCRGEGM